MRVKEMGSERCGLFLALPPKGVVAADLLPRTFMEHASRLVSSSSPGPKAWVQHETPLLDFVFPTTNVGNVGFGDDIQLGITGTESVMQIVREILIGFVWEEDALGRSKQSFRSAHESLLKNLEGLSTERIMEEMTQSDER